MAEKTTSIKEALRKWQDANGIELSEAKDVQLQLRWPPIWKMDNALGVLVNCE
jgi:hypothetical protein